MAQSSLSSSIKALELELGQPIFIRSAGGIKVTPFGNTFIEHGREILKHLSAIENASGSSTACSGTFNVTVYYLLFASYAFSRLCQKHSGKKISFNYIEDSRSTILEKVASGKFEIGLLTLPDIRKDEWLSLIESCGLEYVRFTTEQPVVLAGPNSPLHSSGLSSVTVSDISDMPMIAFDEEHPLFREMHNELYGQLSPSNFINVSDRGTLTNVLTQTDGLYLGTYNHKAYRLGGFYSNVRYFPLLNANFMIEIGYIKCLDTCLSPLAHEYLKSVEHLLI